MGTIKKFAVILAGSGVYDGAEIHEATMTLYAISRNGCSYEIFAPDIKQHHVVNHLTGEEMDEERNVLIEAARIARGNIKALSEFDENKFDALVFPGGFGVAKNLCDFAFKGADCEVISEVAGIIKKMHGLKKPVGALCISPVMLAKVLDDVELTIGQDQGTAEAITKMGGRHINTGHGEVHVDRVNKIVTNPCYMLNANIVQIAEGADNLVKAILEL